MAQEFVENIEKDSKPLKKALKANISKAGALKLPNLLDQRRRKYEIPDQAFDVAPAFDRIFVWPVSDFDGQQTYGDTKILMTDVREKAEKYHTPRGILVAAGLRALDNLKSHGIELGDEIEFIESAPFLRRVGVYAGTELGMYELRDGDITGSRDLAKRLRSGKVKVALKSFTDQEGRKTTQHVYVDEKGKFLAPMDPWIPDDK